MDTIRCDSLARYEGEIQVARKKFLNADVITRLFSSDISPRTLHLFLIYFAALGVAITEPVEGWIRRAGDRCIEIGLAELGTAFHQHARDETDHHLMHLQDVNLLTARWNARHADNISSTYFLDIPLTGGARRYCDLHGTVIKSNTPYCQLAIELEIESLSVRFGTNFIGHCVKLLGHDLFAGLSFLEHHVALDVGHTRFNEKQMDRLLSDHPGYLSSLIDAGRQALTAYEHFVRDCLALAETHTGR